MHALVCFEAAARHRGFKSAAEELSVTPAAISYQVRHLEQELGIELFHRYHRGVELSNSGQQLLHSLTQGLETISACISRLRPSHGKADVTIAATPAVSSLWLTPRLSRFWRDHSDIRVSQILSEFATPRFQWDLSVRYGEMDKEEVPCRLIAHDRIIALGTPDFAARYSHESVEALLNAPLIDVDDDFYHWKGWRSWCEQLGHSSPHLHGFTVNSYVIGIQAALDGVGAILGWESLTRELEQSGRLVRLASEDVASPLSFYIATNPTASSRAQWLSEWLAQGH